MPSLDRLAANDSSSLRAFFSAPQSVASLLSAVLEPLVIVSCWYLLHIWSGRPFGPWATALSLLIIALTFPGRARLGRKPLQMALDIALNWALLLCILGLSAYVTRGLDELDWPLVWEWVLVTPVLYWMALMLLRAFVRRQQGTDHARRQAVVVGGGTLGLRTAQAVAQRDASRRTVVGYFDDRQDGRLEPEARVQWLGRIDEVARYVDKLGVREVYITLPMASQPRMRSLIDGLQGTTASLFFVPDVMGTHIVQGRLQDVSGLAVVGICETPFTGTNELIKRSSDICIASVVLLLTSPVLVLLALGVRISSPGPVFYRQRRIGLDGEEIILTKFRTLRRLQAQRIQGEREVDGEVTRLGRWLQRFSLDDLPQFFNVLQGRLSVVGPSPHAIALGSEYRQQIKGYMVRHKARPGITGWAQINGPWSTDDSVRALRERTDLDLDYLRRWSLGLDLRIMVQAVAGVLRRGWHGA